ncbi:RnfH family protein [Mariprofundus sp. EBB-1]|uniref:RnfH family protein n=1 Tax=Mariprofundus sp. EBB-1 TaxID=2650971 RepID=UPI000EF1F315|nr:RnfH family protein [Mariprofundus sp. EBB-1]RLL55925.1 RnfH family protein [Mariprofundus sp. EBB-1]
MHVSVIYALPQEQFIEELDVAEGTTAEEAVLMSGLMDKHPEIDLKVNKLGIFAKLAKGTQELKTGDRVEIYRALPAKPRNAHAADDKKERIRARKASRATAK